ncbi:LysE family translocator [Leifsonia aquatica]|jgi:threonine/homoserine/homoserine lactone efflux protein|uniref:Translocator protein, LysE family n=2 Tax=Leifsonia aquatica TaxID=144185 RepID=U2R5Q5_LEIAQ|nr:LysE family translocator [Leifsonia aquatica]ERK70585.1 translocator protein, LysE family [Leifsonia aquatica ATCC 14665]MBB2967492.1 threonine/homoserine/homoserine lactone efflux protein [Leifsonia aquatica]
MTALSILAFAGLCLVLALTPGPDTFLVLRYSMGRARDGFAAAAGCAAGSLVWAALVAVGLATLLEQSAELFRIVKIIGGLYLIYLGVAAFVATRRSARAASTEAGAAAEGVDTEPVARRRSTSSLLAGLLSTLLNPKVGLFFLAVVPQFVSAHAGFGETMLLGAVDAAVGGLYLVAITLLASRMVAWLKRPRVTRVIERISAGILAALGIGTVVAGAEG